MLATFLERKEIILFLLKNGSNINEVDVNIIKLK
jgi:hypothetical protein